MADQPLSFVSIHEPVLLITIGCLRNHDDDAEGNVD